RFTRMRRPLKSIPARAHRLLHLLVGDRRWQRFARCRKIFCAQIMHRQICATDKGDAEKNEKCDQNETAFGETTHSFLRWRRLDPRLVRHYVLCAAADGSAGPPIFDCASISLS